MGLHITSTTKISLTIVGSLLCATGTVVAAMMSMKAETREALMSQQHRVETVQTNQQALVEAFKKFELESYSLAAASEVALRTAIENPGVRVPDPRNPDRLIVVRLPGAGTVTGN